MKKNSPKRACEWDLSQLYKSPHDPAIEKQVRLLEKLYADFEKKFNAPGKEFRDDPVVFLAAMRDIERMIELESMPMRYLYHYQHIDAANEEVAAQIALITNRLTNAASATIFFHVGIGKMTAAQQKIFRSDKRLARYRVYLERKWADGKHDLSIGEEKIMSLKSLPAYDMWTNGNDKILNTQTVSWKGKGLPVAQALGMVAELDKHADRVSLSKALSETLQKVSPFSEAEMNAVITNKKIDDELRGYKTPCEATVQSYRNDPAVVESLVKTVTSAFPIAHRFYRLKAKILKQKTLAYADRSARAGRISRTFGFGESVAQFRDILDDLEPECTALFDAYRKERRLDVYPRAGKRSGAYCWASYGYPTFVLLNHTDDLRSFTTLAHEMGHAFHAELSKSQGALYAGHSTSLAETASTFFEYLALDAVYESLSDKEKIVVLHDKINSSISTIFRQIACFNYENDLHETIRAKGFMSKEEIAGMHNKHMGAYLGPVFKLEPYDGYYFVHWSHLRNFFYVYSYAFGELVSQALLRRYKADKSYWRSVKQFLSAGENDSPENILKSIGIDVSKPSFWKEGLAEIEKDIEKLERLTSKKGK